MDEFWWGFIIVMLYIPFLFLWGFTLVDDMFRKDLHAWSKLLWALLILFVPVIGIFIYFISRPKTYDAYDSVGPSYGYTGYDAGYQPGVAQMAQMPPSDIDALTRMHDGGKLSDSEYESLKQRLSPA